MRIYMAYKKRVHANWCTLHSDAFAQPQTDMMWLLAVYAHSLHSVRKGEEETLLFFLARNRTCAYHMMYKYLYFLYFICYSYWRWKKWAKRQFGCCVAGWVIRSKERAHHEHLQFISREQPSSHRLGQTPLFDRTVKDLLFLFKMFQTSGISNFISIWHRIYFGVGWLCTSSMSLYSMLFRKRWKRAPFCWWAWI